MIRTLAAVPAAIAALAIATAAPRDATRAPDAPAAERIRGEVQRLERAGTTLEKAPGMTDVLGRAARALDASRLYLALDELQDPWTFEQASRFAADHASVSTPELFAREWKRLGEPRVQTAGSSRTAAAIRAIAQASASRGPATWRASLPYAEDADMRSGLYYLGESRAFVAYADFCLSLAIDRTAAGPPPAAPALESAIAALEADAANRFDKADADTRPRYIRVNVALKIARTLVGLRQTEGALVQYLVATNRLENIVSTSATGAKDEIVRRLDAARGRLGTGADHSIAELFLERAAALADAGDQAALRSAAVIADRVLPAYLKVTQP